MDITSTQYENDPQTDERVSIRAVIDGITCNVPITEGNRHYDEIMRQVEAGTLTITDAD